jgi:hypothetical protein
LWRPRLSVQESSVLNPRECMAIGVNEFGRGKKKVTPTSYVCQE